MTGARNGGTESHRPYCVTTGKHSYHGRKQAEGALNRVISEGGHPKRVYKCRHCRQWHLTSQEQRAA
jgi:hypothetical protein